MTFQRILIVDDEPGVRGCMVAVLQGIGHNVVAVDCDSDALMHMMDNGPVDLVLSDILMDKVDGLALLDELRIKYPEVPVVIVTAVHDLSIAMAAIRRGAYDYLLKPFANEQLMASVTRALEYRKLTVQNELYKQYLGELVQARTEMLHKTLLDLERSYDITLEALGDALDLRDAETEGHSKRVTAYTLALARAAGLSTEHLRVIARGAFLHDIGKIAIPDSILLKPGKLDAQEIEVMREHCSLGYNMLCKIPYLLEASEIVYSHQERFDGKGYPRVLKGEDIPMGARIFAIADTMDAITTDRPYRAGRSFEEARTEILRCAGTQFDPEIVEVYMQFPNELWADLRKEITQHAKKFSAMHAREPNVESAA